MAIQTGKANARFQELVQNKVRDQARETMIGGPIS